jgi:urease subunit gamma/beta
MMLTPTEMERLTIFTAAELARRRRARGLRLNHPEAIALICDELLEAARDGRTLAETVALGATILTADDVLPGVAEMVGVVAVEGMFEDGSKMITVWQPIRPGRSAAGETVRPGEILFAEGEIEINAAGAKSVLRVTNTGDRPVHVASHLHFFEANAALEFDRAAAFGKRLDLPAGASARFDPGEAREVPLTGIAGTGEVRGLNRLTEGSIHDPEVKDAALARARARGFRGA